MFLWARSLSSDSKFVFPYHLVHPTIPALFMSLGLDQPGNKCVFLLNLSQQRPSPREYEESASVGQGRWRTSANSKVLSNCSLLVGPHAHSSSNSSFGACCLGKVLTSFLPPGSGEIDRCLKKVSEGVEQFEDIWQKVLGLGSKTLGLQGEGMLRTSEK